MSGPSSGSSGRIMSEIINILLNDPTLSLSMGYHIAFSALYYFELILMYILQGYKELCFSILNVVGDAADCRYRYHMLSFLFELLLNNILLHKFDHSIN